MNSKWIKLSLVAVVVLVGLFAVGSAAYAQGPVGPGGQRGFGGPEDSLVAIAAKTLNMTQVELVTALRGGKTIAEVAKSKNVATEKIVEAFVTERQANLKAAVTAGRMTQAQADALLAYVKVDAAEQINKAFTAQGRGMGVGPGFVDKNNDGLCDNCAAPSMGRGRMTTPRGGMGGRMGGGMMQPGSGRWNR